MIASAASLRLDPPVFPFEERTIHESGLTYGLSVAGYDIRCDQYEVIEPGDFKLMSSLEQFNMPNHLLGIVHDKSTWARRGICMQNTVIEPGWRGFLTLEVTNHGRSSIVIKRGTPIAQVVFHWLDQGAGPTYEGRYQDQPPGPQPAIMKR